MNLINRLSDLFTSMGIANTHCVEYGYDIFRDRSGNNICAFVLRASDFIGLASIENFNVGDNYKSSENKRSDLSIGFHVLQAIISELLKIDMDKLELDMVRHDGLTFWPKYGATPENISRLKIVIEGVLDYACLDQTEIEKLQLAQERAEDDPNGVWLDFTDPDSGLYLERETLKLLSEDLANEGTMVIDLSCPVVHERLDLNL